jgi:hypothetical protein
LPRLPRLPRLKCQNEAGRPRAFLMLAILAILAM